MKKAISTILILLLTLSLLCGCGGNANVTTEQKEQTTDAIKTVHVKVSISDKTGSLVLAVADVMATDIDRDGTVTLAEAIKCAHITCPQGKDGFQAETSIYGLSMTKLWGEENGGAFGYYLNNASPASLLAEVKEDDYIVAFSYTDTTYYGDVYTYFDQVQYSVNETVSVTLTSLGFDNNWAPVSTPVVGAKILVDGIDSGIVTDENGTATVTAAVGSHILSASCETLTIVPPSAVLTVSDAN